MAVPEAAERKAFALTVVGMSLLCVGLGAAAYFGYDKTKGMSGENAKLEKTVEDLRKKAEQLPAKKEELKKAEVEKNRYEELLPTGKEQIEDLFDKLSAVATDTELEVVKSERIEERAVFGGQQPEQKPYKEIAFEFEFRGTFHELAHFISVIENFKAFKRFIAVSNLGIEAQSRGLVYDDGTQRHKFEMKLTTYRYEEGKTGGAGGDPLAGIPPSVIAVWKSQGKDPLQEVLKQKGDVATAAGGGTAAGKIIDIFSEDYRPAPEYQIRKDGVDRIDPFTFAAGPKDKPRSPVLAKVQKLVAGAQDKIGRRDYKGAMSSCREALVLIDGAEGLSEREQRLLKSERPAIEDLLLEAKRLEEGGGPVPDREKVRKLIAQASAEFDRGAYDAAMKKCREALIMIDAAEGLLEGERPAADQLYLTAERLERRRQIEEEFARLSLTIEVVAWKDPGAVAVINGRLVKEGDRIMVAQPRGSARKPEAVYIYRIRPHAVIFLYRGVKFTKRTRVMSKAPPPEAP